MIEEIMQRLAIARKEAGLTQSQAARLIGVSSRTITHWESQSKRWPPLNTFIKMCELYGVNIVWVMTGTNPDLDPAPTMQLLDQTAVTKADQEKIIDLLESTAKREDVNHA